MMGFDLSHLPLQKQLVDDVFAALIAQPDVIAAVLLGSLVNGKADQVFDADLLILRKMSFTHLKYLNFLG